MEWAWGNFPVPVLFSGRAVKKMTNTRRGVFVVCV